MRPIFSFLLSFIYLATCAQNLITPFEKSKGEQTATYFECMEYYRKLDKISSKISLAHIGTTDAGYPCEVALYSNDGRFDPKTWHRQNKLVILIINGIHPGEPDGVDASMMLLRDLNNGSVPMPDNVALAVIPLYNVGGALNRSSFSRVNQNGPKSYGFRGNAQNLDLNRDFTKNDSRNARAFAQIFHWLDPDIQVDNHVSDGADYQHTMTLLTTQWNKLGGELGKYLHDVFEPAIYQSMEKKGWPMCPYVNFEEGNPEKGWTAFYDPPRFSSGYATLFNTLAFIPETHMLKPFRDRVYSTYALMRTVIEEGSKHSQEVIQRRKQNIADDLQKTEFALSWQPDTNRSDWIHFKGYESYFKPSEVTGAQRLFYDHSKPFEKLVKFNDYFRPEKFVVCPKEYIIPQGWQDIIDLLRLNGVVMRQLPRDSIIQVQSYHIEEYKSLPKPYEKHHKNSGVRVLASSQQISFLKGDYLVNTNQSCRRFLIEMLEPTGDDSYFSWNFFDAILQQKEGYSEYRWEDLAAVYLKDHPDLKAKFEEKKKTDTEFARNPSAQLDFVYKNSPYFESAYLRYPVYRIR
jgi:Zinc carboxypeptidase